jgi:hypothetical protein
MKIYQCERCHNRMEVPRGIIPTRCQCNGEVKRITKAELQREHIAEIRADSSRTAERYDEIVALRMLLLDVVERIKDWDLDYLRIGPQAEHLVKRIEDRSESWGKEGDCV